jgi:hypothetical protein
VLLNVCLASGLVFPERLILSAVSVGTSVS